MKIILASASPRRKELLGYITKNFEVIVSNADESFKEGLTIQEQSKRIAYLKAKEVFDKTTGDRIIIGSDTLVLKMVNIMESQKTNKKLLKWFQNYKMMYMKLLQVYV